MLRAYQKEAIARVRAAFAGGAKRVCLVMPTGSGKTRTGGAMVSDALSRGRRVLWLAHRAELVEQACAHLAAMDLPCTALSASAKPFGDPGAPVTVATVQTLLARNLRPCADRIILDEAHHYAADQFGALAKSYDTALTVGLTATPQRGDGRGLDDLFDAVAVGPSVAELVADGYLVHAQIMRPADRLRSTQIAQSPVDAYRENAAGQKAICFSPNVDAATQTAANFCAAGIPAAVIHAETDTEYRRMVMDAFRKGAVRVLCNVYVLTEGFDVPDVSCCILARNVGTIGTYLQMVGRVLRPAEGKTGATILDLQGVSYTHGHPEDVYSFSLAGIRNNQTPDENRYCSICGCLLESDGPCPDCETELRRAPKPLSVTGEPLVKYAAKRAESTEARSATLARWAAFGKANGYKPGWLYHKARTVYGSADWRECERLMT